MKVLFVLQHVNFFRNLDTVLRELHARGHQIVVLHGTAIKEPNLRDRRDLPRRTKKVTNLGRGLQAARQALPDVDVAYRPDPPGAWHERLMMWRQVLSRGIYMRPWHPSPARVTEGLEEQMSPAMRRFVRSPLWRRVLWRPWALRAWRSIEAAGPACPTVVDTLRRHAPDVVLVSPVIWPRDPVEADYLHAAHALGVPTIGYVNSWDNLTSKGTVHVLPDAFVVWNEPMAEEAAGLHDVPRDAIRVTGAPHLDCFFALSTSTTREALCAAMGCPDGRPYVVFLCSSRTLAPDETPLVTALAEAFARRFGEAAPAIVVRPHPTNAEIWARYSRRGVVVYPGQGDQADTPDAWQAYFDQLSLAACAVGLNTTAFLEAAVADRPCLTIVAEKYTGSQGFTGHFRHLLAGGFLETCTTWDEVAARVGHIVGDGADERREGRRRFVRQFLRPCGIDRPAAAVVADLVENLARRPAAAAAPRRGRGLRALVGAWRWRVERRAGAATPDEFSRAARDDARQALTMAARAAARARKLEARNARLAPVRALRDAQRAAAARERAARERAAEQVRAARRQVQAARLAAAASRVAEVPHAQRRPERTSEAPRPARAVRLAGRAVRWEGLAPPDAGEV
ncbi:MAG: hypothetical protein AB7O67_04425 [Vicinamibacterales bacterium]